MELTQNLISFLLVYGVSKDTAAGAIENLQVGNAGCIKRKEYQAKSKLFQLVGLLQTDIFSGSIFAKRGILLVLLESFFAFAISPLFLLDR